MHSYDNMRSLHGRRVSQTIDSPITIFDYWELADAFVAISVILIFGVLFYEWLIMTIGLVATMIVLPALRRNHERGIILHWPYRHIGVSLPGLVNPGSAFGLKRYSD